MPSLPFAYKTRFVAGTASFGLVAWLLIIGFRSPEWHLGALWFNAYALLSLTSLIVTLILILFIMSKPARTEERLWLAAYLVLAALYAAGELMTRLSATPEGALFWSNIVTPAALIAPVAFLFALAYTNHSEHKQPILVAVLLAAACLYMYFMNFTNFVFINDPKLAVLEPWGWDFGSALGPGAPIALIWYVLFFGLALARLASFRHVTKNPIMRKQSLLFIFALAIPPLAATVLNLGLPVFGVTNIVPLGVPIGSFSLILLVYGVYKYQLLTINPTLFATTMLNITKEAFIATDQHFRIIYQNPTAAQLLGLSGNAKRGVSLLRKLSPESVPTFRRAYETHADVVTIDHIDIRMPQGNQMPVRVTASQLMLGNDKLWIMALADITAELQNRSVIEQEVRTRTAELHTAQTYLQSSIASLSQGFVLVDTRLRIQSVNHAARRTFKLRDQENPAELADLITHVSWGTNVSKEVERTLAMQRSKVLAVASEDGYFYQVFLTPVVSADHVLGATVVIQDVTEQKILERSKDEFFSIASHELRTPLTAIRGNMSMARDYFGDKLKDTGLRDLIEDTHTASVRLIGIVNDFLDSSKLEQGKMMFEYGPVKIAPLVTSVLSDLRVIREHQGNKAINRGLDELPPVWADEGRLRQILYNLFSNANKYSQNATITISGQVEGDNVRLRITDTGKGMSPENQKLLFHKFQQAGSSILTRDDTKGTGLGLYISKLMANKMHGDVLLESSEEGKGSTFAVILPIATPAQLKAAATPPVQAPRARDTATA